MMKTNIFIISAAHQYIYIYDAVKRFHHQEENFLFLLNFGSENEFISLKRILLDIQWSGIFEITLYAHKSLIYRYCMYINLIKKLKKYSADSICLSQLGASYCYLILNSVDCKTKMITDDGVSLLIMAKDRIEKINNGHTHTSLKSNLKKFLFKLYEPNHLTFFTTNNIEICSNDRLIVNDLSHVKFAFSQNDSVDSYIFIGSPFVSYHMMTLESYIKLLKRSFAKYTDKKIIYYPHRAEQDNELFAIREMFDNIEVISSLIPFEMYLLINSYPEKIIAFYSGVIPNILKIFGNLIKIDSIVIPDNFFIKYEDGDAGRVVYAEYGMYKNDCFQMVEI